MVSCVYGRDGMGRGESIGRENITVGVDDEVVEAVEERGRVREDEGEEKADLSCLRI